MELFAEATDYDPVVVIGEMAHVAGASDGGPRADADLSAKERNDYENLILLCRNCHGRIDKQAALRTRPPACWPSSRTHEAWVRAQLAGTGRSSTGWKAVSLVGDHPVDLATADAALSPDFMNGDPAVSACRRIRRIGRLSTGTSPRRRAALLTGDDLFDQRIAVFPLAPVSACMSLGYHLTSRPNVRLFQHHRDERTWAWPRLPLPAQDITVTGFDERDAECQVVTFLFHLSAVITDAVVAEMAEPVGHRVDIRVETPSTAWLRHPDQIRWAAAAARQAFEQAMQDFPGCRLWRVLYAGSGSRGRGDRTADQPDDVSPGPALRIPSQGNPALPPEHPAGRLTAAGSLDCRAPQSSSQALLQGAWNEARR